MTDLQKTPQSISEQQDVPIRSILVGISSKVDELNLRVSNVESSIDDKLREHVRNVKTDLEGRIIAESADRRVIEAYNKAKFEMYDSQLRSLEASVEKSQRRTEEMLRENDTKTDKLSEAVSSLNTKMMIGVGAAVFAIEMLVKVLSELLK